MPCRPTDRASSPSLTYLQRPLPALRAERQPHEHVGRQREVGAQGGALTADDDLLGAGRREQLPRLELRKPLIDQRRAVLLAEQQHLPYPHPRDQVHLPVHDGHRVEQVAHLDAGAAEARLGQVRAAEEHRERLVPDRQRAEPAVHRPEHRVRLGHPGLPPAVLIGILPQRSAATVAPPRAHRDRPVRASFAVGPPMGVQASDRKWPH